MKEDNSWLRERYQVVEISETENEQGKKLWRIDIRIRQELLKSLVGHELSNEEAHQDPPVRTFVGRGFIWKELNRDDEEMLGCEKHTPTLNAIISDYALREK